jgi:hypothetical protein
MVAEAVSDLPADDVNDNIADHASDVDDGDDTSKANVLDKRPSEAVSPVAHDSSLKAGEIDLPIFAGSIQLSPVT